MRLLEDLPSKPEAAIVLAHGAGAPMDSDFMNSLTEALNRQHIGVFRFEFPYMAQRRAPDGKKRPPDKAAVLIETWQQAFRAAMDQWDSDLPLLVGGKSMGGRIASMVVDDLGAMSVCCYGYPFHPPGRPDKLRTAHLETLETPALILQGTRDPFGKPAEFSSIPLGSKIKLHWLNDGDHDFKPRKRSGLTQQQLIDEAALRTAYFAKGLYSKRR